MTLNAKQSPENSLQKIKPMIIELKFEKNEQNSEKFDSKT